MSNLKKRKIKEFRRQFTYASFTWSGDIVAGRKFAEQTRREVVKFIQKAIDKAERETLERVKEAVLMADIESLSHYGSDGVGLLGGGILDYLDKELHPKD